MRTIRDAAGTALPSVRRHDPLARRLIGWLATALLVGGCAGGDGGDGTLPWTGGLPDGGKADDAEDDTDAAPADEDDGSTGEGSADTDAEEELDEISQYIFDLGHLDVDNLVPKTEGDCGAPDCPIDGQEGEEFCSYVHYDETVHAHEFVAFQPNSATLWPGSIVQGEDAEHGLLTPIGLPRAPMTFSVSLENLQGSPVGEMESPSLSSFREERNSILSAGTVGEVPAQLSYDMRQVYDASQVMVSVGASVGWLGAADISSMFEFENTQRATKILVDFTQAYYTIDVDTPGLPKDFFSDDVSVGELENFMDVENPPMYVQSITFGRRVIFALESSYSADEVRFAFDAGFDAFVVSGGIDIATEHRQVLEETKISALVLGGSGSEAVKSVFGFDGLLEYLSTGGNFTKDSPGAQIAYKLAYLDNSGVQLAFTTDYSERQCYDNFIDVSGALARLQYLGGNESGTVEVYGHLEFRVAPPGEVDPCNTGSNWQTIFDRDDDGAQDVSGMWVAANPAEKTIYDFEVADGNQLCMKGRLREADVFNNDDFGRATLGPIPLSSGWAGDYDLEFSDEGTVVATIRISVD